MELKYKDMIKALNAVEEERNIPAEVILDALKEKGILGGLPLDGDEGSRILWCCTEMNTKKDIDEVVAVIKEVLAC